MVVITMLEQKVYEWVDLSEGIDVRTRDPFARFAMLWVAFNVYYAFRCGERTQRSEHGDWQELSALADRPEAQRAHLLLLDKRDGLYLAAVGTLVDAERTTHNVLRSGLHRDRNDLRALLKAVYRIRCNLFHGLKSPSDLLDRRVVEAAAAVVSLLIAELVPRLSRQAAG